MKGRKSPPTENTQFDDDQPFRVWVHNPVYDEDPRPWKCVAIFYFLLDALDYIADCQDKGVNVVFQSPGRTELILAKDKRVVYQG